MTEIAYSFQDFNLLNGIIEKHLTDYGEKYKIIGHKGLAFPFFVLDHFHDLQEDEIVNAITDSAFVIRKKGYNRDEDFAHDRGIDAIIINEINEEEQEVHLFNFKYVESFEKTKNFFPSNEIDKVSTFLTDLLGDWNIEAFANANPQLKEKIEEIIYLVEKKHKLLKFKLHFVSNLYHGFSDDEEKRLKERLKKFRKVSFDYLLLDEISESLISRDDEISGKLRIDKKAVFQKNYFGYNAIVFEISALDIIRMTCVDSDLRVNVDASTVEKLKRVEIEELAFDDNVRVYLKQRGTINQGIKETVLSEDGSKKFFFYNNGITLTCIKSDFGEQGSFPILTLEGMQIVNGGQTIHSLRDALNEDPSNIENVSLLCRIYETRDNAFKSKISEYTNTQNPVVDRDIRSIDVVQIKLEKDFEQMGYFYERKKNQYENKEKSKRIDAEKLGQSMLAFYELLPMEAKNRKKIVFGDKYSSIFNSTLTAEKAFLAIELYKYIEGKKLEMKEQKPYLSHATYYILYFIRLICGKNKKYKDYVETYNEALCAIEKIIEKEKERLNEDYFDAHLFKSNRPITYLSELELSDDHE